MAKKIIAWLLVIVLTAGIAIAGTLAYLTDRDSEANVFTAGDVDITLKEEFEQDSQLKPGVDINKDVQIKNEGPNAAYVWYTYAVPQGLEDGLILTFENESDWTNDAISIGTKEVGGVTYNVYACKYNTVVGAGETTPIGLTKVTMDPAVDITPEGDAYLIKQGVATDLNWNINETENPIIFINAFAIQTQGFADVNAAFAAFAGQWGNMVDAGTYDVADPWDGTSDISWFEDAPEDTGEFYITTAEQMAGLAELVDAGETFAGKTLKLGKNIDLAGKSFDPIGDKSPFKGTFDGQGYTISNLYQSGWDFGYEWGKYGSLGLFGELDNATVKNLTIANAEVQIEGGDVGGITGSATGNCTFENITITGTKLGTYNNGLGGIIGWSGAGNYTFKNITIDENTVLAGLWGSFDSSIGGIVGQAEPGATYNFENVNIKCRLDVYNDCTASYDYYNYRMCGMIMGRLEETTTIDGTNYPDTTKYNINCSNVTVAYGDWMNYHYCRAAGARGIRVEAGYAYGGIAADYDHSVCTVHHQELIPFDQIFGGAQYGVKGLKTYNGVTVIYPN